MLATMVHSSFCLLLVLASSALSGVPYCNHESCNPSYEPYPNLHAAMVGYHIMQGNPFDIGQMYDRGFKTAFIFHPMVKNADKKYHLHAGVAATGRSSCQLAIHNDIITNVKDYQTRIVNRATEGTDFSSNMEIEVSAGVPGLKAKGKIPPIVQAKFTASKAFGESERFFTKEQGIVSMSDATCPSYTLHVSRFNPPPFSPTFINGLKFLEKYVNSSSLEQDTAFNYFVNEFGTHFVSFAVMGARIAITSRYTQKEFHQQGQTNITKCNAHRIGVSFIVSVGNEKNKCSQTQGANSKKLANGMSRYYVSSYGSRPKKDLHDWANQKFDEPAPIKMQLSPIVNLFQSTYMNTARLGQQLDYQSILKFFGPRYWNYCANNKDRLGVDSCQPDQTTGCGWDDTCARGIQSCIDKTDGNTTKPFCCDNPCLKAPCGSGGSCKADMNACSYTCDCLIGYKGADCKERYVDQDLLKAEVTEQMRVGSKLTTGILRRGLVSWFEDEYPDYRFMVIVFTDGKGDGGEYDWAKNGYVGYQMIVERYNKRVAIAWTLQTETARSGYEEVAADAVSVLSGPTANCDMGTSRDMLWMMAKKHANFVLLMRYTSKSQVSSSWSKPEGFYRKFQCGEDCNIWGTCTPMYARMWILF